MEAPKLHWDARLQPARLETEFWLTSHSVKSYMKFADRWSWLLVIGMNLVNLVSRDFRCAPYGFQALATYFPECFILCACAQRLLLQVKPGLYWKHRASITYVNVWLRVAQIYLFPVNGEALRLQVNRQLESKPPWAVVLSMLVASGPIYHVLWRLSFPMSFRATLLVSGFCLWFSVPTQIHQAIIILGQSSAQVGVGSICKGVHIVLGGFLFIPEYVIALQIKRCAQNCMWIVCFAQLLGVTLTLEHTYSTEIYLKSAFLKEEGIADWEPSLLQKPITVTLCLVASYIGAYVLQDILAKTQFVF